VLEADFSLLPEPQTCLNGIGLWPSRSRAELVHAVAVQAALEDVADQHGVVDRRDAGRRTRRHDGDVVLGVLGDLEDRRVLEQRLEAGEGRRLVDLGEVALPLSPPKSSPAFVFAGAPSAGCSRRRPGRRPGTRRTGRRGWRPGRRSRCRSRRPGPGRAGDPGVERLPGRRTQV
jgi:hypothetical protein